MGRGVGLLKSAWIEQLSGEVCWGQGEGSGERNGGGVGKCVRVWGPSVVVCTS